jgi:hypothetical protein
MEASNMDVQIVTAVQLVGVETLRSDGKVDRFYFVKTTSESESEIVDLDEVQEARASLELHSSDSNDTIVFNPDVPRDYAGLSAYLERWRAEHRAPGIAAVMAVNGGR